jgi:plasmid stabilization system protein ParE
VPRTLEFLDEAIEEAEAAARWYAERSPTAAAAFADEIDSAIAEIIRLPLAWPAYNHNTAFPAREISLQASCIAFRIAPP